MTSQVPLQDSLLDEVSVGQLFFDIANAAELIAVLQKGTATQRAGGAASSPDALEDAHRALATGQIGGVQIRYRFGGEEWWDTLLRTERGVRLIRVSHTRALAAAPAAP